MFRRIVVLGSLIIFAAACSSRKSDTTKKKPGDIDWAKMPLQRVDAVAKKAAFSIELPKGMDKSVGSISTSWHLPGEARYVSPRIHVGFSALPPPGDLATAVRRSLLTTEKHTVRTKRAIPGGFLVVHYNAKKSKIVATVHLRLSDTRTLYCGASQARGGGVPDADAVMDWLGTICSSLKPKK